MQTTRVYTGGAAWHRDQPQPRILGCRDAECILTGRKAKGTAAPTQGEGEQALQPKSDQAFRSKGNTGGGARGSKLNDTMRNEQTDMLHPTSNRTALQSQHSGTKVGAGGYSRLKAAEETKSRG